MAGSEFEIRAGGAHAVVTGVGAGLRAFTVDGAHHVETYEGDPPMGAGCVLIPWPNRTAGARFTFRGEEHDLEVTEPAHGNAIHGLVRKRPWTLVEHTDDAVTLAIDVPGGTDEDAHGWPEPLHVETTYALEPTQLTVTHVLTNTGAADVPAGVGTHPYLRVGDHPSGDCTLRVPTATVLDGSPAFPVAHRSGYVARS